MLSFGFSGFIYDYTKTLESGITNTCTYFSSVRIVKHHGKKSHEGDIYIKWAFGGLTLADFGSQTLNFLHFGEFSATFYGGKVFGVMHIR